VSEYLKNHTLTLNIPDSIYGEVNRLAHEKDTTPEAMAGVLLRVIVSMLTVATPTPTSFDKIDIVPGTVYRDSTGRVWATNTDGNLVNVDVFKQPYQGTYPGMMWSEPVKMEAAISNHIEVQATYGPIAVIGRPTEPTPVKWNTTGKDAQ